MLLILQTIPDATPAKRPIDEAWLSQIADGDVDALQRLYAAVGNQVYGFALSLVRHPQDAEDVLQETFVRIHAYAAQYRPQGKPLAWIFTIARHVALDKKRRRPPTQSLSDVAEEVDLSAVERADHRLLLTSLLNHLSEEDRQILILHAAVGLTFREIATVVGRPLNTVLSRYRRAMNRLQSIVKEDAFND